MKVSAGHPLLSNGTRCPLCSSLFVAGDLIELRNTKPATEQDREKHERGQTATFEAVVIHRKCLPARSDRGSLERRGMLLFLEAKSRANNLMHDLANVDWIDATTEGTLEQLEKVLEEYNACGRALAALAGLTIAPPDGEDPARDHGAGVTD